MAYEYEKNTWNTGDPEADIDTNKANEAAVTAEKLTHMENGIGGAYDAINEVDGKLAGKANSGTVNGKADKSWVEEELAKIQATLDELQGGGE